MAYQEDVDDPARAARLLVADIGGSFIRMASAGPRFGDVGDVRSLSTPTADLEGFLGAIAALARDLSHEVEPGAPLVLATAGLCDAAAGTVAAANIPCLSGVPVAARLAERLERPIGLLNDADAFALAEAAEGVGRGHGVVFGAILGTGVGGGLVVDGRIVSGRGGAAGEWGHGPVANQMPSTLGRPLARMACACGQTGCADTFGGARGLERLHALVGHPEATSQAITDGWRDGDAAARETVALWVEMLSEPLALVVNATGASLVATGGGLGRDAALMSELDRALRARLLAPPSAPVLHPGRIDNAALNGAAVFGRQIYSET